MFHNDYYVEREAWNSQIAENAARGAWAWGTAHTQGWGELVLDEPIMFGVTFTEQPSVAYGFTLDDDDQVVDGRLPRCSGGVMRWVRSDDDFYVGAHVFVTVATADPMLAAQAWVEAAKVATSTDPAVGGSDMVYPQVPVDYETDPDYDITHSFTFQAMAIKDVTP